MKTSMLIKKLQKIYLSYGDLDVYNHKLHPINDIFFFGGRRLIIMNSEENIPLYNNNNAWIQDCEGEIYEK